MPKITAIMRLERRTDLDGKTLYFMTPSGGRRHPAEFLDPQDVPDFEGDAATFELERFHKGPWLKWRAVRRVGE